MIEIKMRASFFKKLMATIFGKKTILSFSRLGNPISIVAHEYKGYYYTWCRIEDFSL